MRYLFLSSFCFENEELELLKISKGGLQSSIITFQRNMLKGIQDNMIETDSIDIINFYPIGSYPKNCLKVFLNGKKIGNCRVLSIINIHIIKQIFIALQAFYFIIQWIIKNKNDKKCIITYDLLFPYINIISHIYSRKIYTSTIVADLIGKYGYKKNDGKIKDTIKTFLGKYSMNSIKKLRSVGLLTEQMSGPLQLTKEKYTIIEGFSDRNRYYRPLEENQRIFLYTGVVSSEYQIDILLKAFNLIKDSTFKLWICGSGLYVKEVINAIQNDQRIKYWGHLTQKEVADLQSKATILINPRQNVSEYTKYSFPSKIIEYLSTARPVIAYKLDGISDDYYNYLITPDDNTPTALKYTMEYVALKPINELVKIGNEGRQFVLTRTDPQKQIYKLLNI